MKLIWSSQLISDLHKNTKDTEKKYQLVLLINPVTIATQIKNDEVTTCIPLFSMKLALILIKQPAKTKLINRYNKQSFQINSNHNEYLYSNVEPAHVTQKATRQKSPTVFARDAISCNDPTLWQTDKSKGYRRAKKRRQLLDVKPLQRWISSASTAATTTTAQPQTDYRWHCSGETQTLCSQWNRIESSSFQKKK